MRMRGLIIPVLLLLPILAACDAPPEKEVADPGPRPVKVAIVSAEGADQEYTYAANVLAAKEAELSFRVSGQIIELPVLAAMDVKKGDLIARLDPRDFQSNVSQVESQLQAERARLEAMTAGARSEDLAALRDNVAAAEAQVAASRAQAEQTLTQYRRGVVAKEQLDSSLASLKAAEAQLAAQRQELSKGRTGSRGEEVAAQQAVIASLEAQVRSASDTETDTRLVAPFDGVIAERLVDNFANIQPKEPIVLIQDLTTLELSFDIPGPDVATLGPRREKLKLEAILDADPTRRFPAEVVEFKGQADSRTRTFEGRAAIARPDDMVILPGMTGRIVVTDTTVDRQGVFIPAAALTATAAGDPAVWVVEANNTVTLNTVRVGPLSGDMAEISDGVEAGQMVVIAGLDALQSGLEVRPLAEAER